MTVLHKLDMEISNSSDKRMTVGQFRDIINNMVKCGSLRSQNIKPKEILRSYTVLAGHITELLIHSTEEIDYDTYAFLSVKSQEISTIFSASGYQSAMHIVRALGRYDGDNFDIDMKYLPGACLVLGINEIPNELMSKVLSYLEPKYTVPLIFGWLSESFVYSEIAEQNRKILHENIDLIRQAEWNDAYYFAINSVYMFCSYANFDHRLELKATINDLLSAKHANYGKLAAPKTSKPGKKPKLVIIHEHFRSTHSMFRCFSPLMEQLRKHFTTIAFAELGHIDDLATPLFDQVRVLGKNRKFDLRDLINDINDIAPDIIFYPSIGMSYWAIILSNFRLAPVQLAGQGHPGSTMSKVIDYALINKVKNDPRTFYLEKTIAMDEIGLSLSADFVHEKTKSKQVQRDYLKIGINSKLMKLSPEFLKILKEIDLETETKIEFNFFPAAEGIVNDSLHAILNLEFKYCCVHNAMHYSDFLRELSSCDFLCAAFPFGNTNGTVDACLIGIPSFALNGRHFSDQTDSLIIDFFKFPEELLCDNVDDYKNTVIRMVDDVDYRNLITKKCREIDTNEALQKQIGSKKVADALMSTFEDHWNRLDN